MTANVPQSAKRASILTLIEAATCELLRGVRWVRQGGTLKAASLAYQGQNRIGKISLESLEDRDQLAFLEFRDAVNSATRGPLSQGWNAEAVDGALAALRREWHGDRAEDVGPDVARAELILSTDGPLPRRIEAALRSCELAEINEGRELSMREAYKWLRDNRPPEYKLPKFDTWARYVREAWQHHAERRANHEVARYSRSAVRQSDIDLPRGDRG